MAPSRIASCSRSADRSSPVSVPAAAQRAAPFAVVVAPAPALAEQAPPQDAGGALRGADGAEQDRVVLPDRGQVLAGQRLAGLQPAPSTEVELRRGDRHIRTGQRG